MTSYVAFLHGINVGSHKKVKIENLRKALESLASLCSQTFNRVGQSCFYSLKTDSEQGDEHGHQPCKSVSRILSSW